MFMKKKISAIVIVSLLLSLFGCQSAWAIVSDSAGNALSSEESIDSSSTEGDLFWMGLTTDITSTTINGDALILGFGDSVDFNNSQVTGSIRALAQNITINATEVQRNITVAANTLQIGQGTTALGVYLLGNNVGYYGSSNALTIFGNYVVFDGYVDGNVEINAYQEVVIGSNAVITGTLTVFSSTEPVLAEGASISNYVYNSQGASSFMGIPSDWSQAFFGTTTIFSIIFSLVVAAITALLMNLVMKKEIAASAEMIKKSSISMIITGIITVIVVPFLVIVLIMMMATIQVAILILLIALILAIISVPFAGMSIARAIFPQLNTYLSSVIGSVVLVVLSLVPFLTFIVLVVCSIYTAGYFVKAVGMRIKNSNMHEDAGNSQQRV